MTGLSDSELLRRSIYPAHQPQGDGLTAYIQNYSSKSLNTVKKLFKQWMSCHGWLQANHNFLISQVTII